MSGWIKPDDYSGDEYNLGHEDGRNAGLEAAAAQLRGRASQYHDAELIIGVILEQEAEAILLLRR